MSRFRGFSVVRSGCFLLLLASSAHSAIYEVGPGKPYASLAAVPWNSIVAGDTVNIYPKAGNAPYYEKLALSKNGTAGAPITIQGVLDASGQRPILDGTGATQAGTYTTNRDRGLIQTGAGSSGTGNYIIIQNLELRNAYYTNQYYDSGWRSYGSNAAGVFVQNGDHVTIRNCWIHGNGNGIQTGGKGAGCTNLLIEACRVEGNGVVKSDGTGSSQEHNFYVSAEPVTVQYCYIGALRAGADGQNYKDRGSGTVLCYNWIEGGPNGQLDLVHGGTKPAHAYVYGNVIIKNNNAGNGRMCLFGGDSGSGSRTGTLYFMNNTFISTRTSGTTYVFQISPSGNAVQAYNNILYHPNGGSYLTIQNGNAGGNCSNNWISPGYSAGLAAMSNTIPLSGNVPGFVNYSAKDFHLAPGSACIDAGALSWPAQSQTTPVLQPIQPLSSEARPSDGHIDIGAYEFAYRLGDLNRDGLVNASDLLVLAGAWGTSSGQPGFNAVCDLNGDDVINIADLLRLAADWGA